MAISQSNYLPWRGYFHLIDSVDIFVLLDDVQFTKRDWRNRNKIKSASGATWLTLPVETKGKYKAKIYEIQTSDESWKNQHIRTREHMYARAGHATTVLPWLREVFAKAPKSELYLINRHFVQHINQFLGIDTVLASSLDFDTPSDPNDRLVAICSALGAQTYVSGPAAKQYLDESQFAASNIDLEWFQYGPYSEYPQLWGPWEERVSVVDLLLNIGDEATHVFKLIER